jgi:hypothetical protein
MLRAQGFLFIAQVTVTCAQVSKWKWNLERSRFGCEYMDISIVQQQLKKVANENNNVTASS